MINTLGSSRVCTDRSNAPHNDTHVIAPLNTILRTNSPIINIIHEKDQKHVHDHLIGPLRVQKLDHYATGPFGLYGFAFSCFFGGLESLHIVKLDVPGMIVFLMFGGVCQYIIGIFDMLKGNSLSAMLGITFGLYNAGFILTSSFPIFGWTPVADGNTLGCYNFIWTLYTLIAIISSVKGPKIVLINNILVTLSFFFQCVHAFADNNNVVEKITGVVQLLIAANTFYVCSSYIITSCYGITFLPLLGPNEVTYWNMKKDKKQS